MYNIHEISSTQFLLKFVKLIKLLFLSIICIIFGLYLTCVDGLAATSITTGTCCYAIFNCKESIGVILLVANKSFQWHHTIRGTMFSADVTVFEISIVSQHRVIADAIGHRAPAFIYVCLSLLTLKCSKFVIRLTLSLFIRNRIFFKITYLALRWMNTSWENLHSLLSNSVVCVKFPVSIGPARVLRLKPRLKLSFSRKAYQWDVRMSEWWLKSMILFFL